MRDEEIVDHSHNILDIQESHSTGLPGSLVASQRKEKELVASLNHIISTTDTSPDTTMCNSQPCPPVTEVASLAPAIHRHKRRHTRWTEEQPEWEGSSPIIDSTPSQSHRVVMRAIVPSGENATPNTW